MSFSWESQGPQGTLGEGGAGAAPTAVEGADRQRGRPAGPTVSAATKATGNRAAHICTYPGTATAPLWGKELGPQNPDPHPAAPWLLW